MKILNTLMGVMVILGITTTQLASDEYCTPIPISEVISANTSINLLTSLTKELINTSEQIYKISETMISMGILVNNEDIDRLLKVVDNTLKVVETVQIMSDDILEMGEQIGDMSDRILSTQLIQSDNLIQTQDNLLKAQNNLLRLK